MVMNTNNNTLDQARHLYAKSPAPSKGGEWVTKPDFHEVRKTLGEAFVGLNGISNEPFYAWGVNHLEKEKWFTNEVSRTNMAFGMGFTSYVAIKSKALVVSKRYEGKLASTALVHEYDHAKEKSFRKNIVMVWRYARAFFAMKKAEPIPDFFVKKEFQEARLPFDKKMESMNKELEQSHLRDGPKEKHWHIQVVGVKPEFKGKGFGRELMEEVHNLADQVGMSCYLECGSGNCGFYEKMGYALVSQTHVDDPTDPAGESLEINMMLRRAKKSSV